MPWLPNYPETQWGNTRLDAAPIAGVMALRQQQQQHVQNQIMDAIQQYQRDKVANALTGQYAQEGLVPQELTGMGATGAGAAADYIKAQQYLRTPTDIGGGYNLNLTEDQRLRAAIASQALKARQAASTASASPQTQWFNGREYYLGQGNHWIPMKPAAGDKPVKPMTGKEMLDAYGVYPGQLNSPQQHGVVIDQESGQPRYTKPGEKATHVAFGAYPSRPSTSSFTGLPIPADLSIPEKQTVLSNEEVDALRGAGRIKVGVPPPADQNVAPGYGAPPAPPKTGDVIKGYRFKGGNPADQNNWEKV